MSSRGHVRQNHLRGAAGQGDPEAVLIWTSYQGDFANPQIEILFHLVRTKF